MTIPHVDLQTVLTQEFKVRINPHYLVNNGKSHATLPHPLDYYF